MTFRVKTTESQNFYYGNGGYQNNYHNIKGQLNLFWTTYCDDSCCTEGDEGFIPGVLYSGGEINESIRRHDD